MIGAHLRHGHKNEILLTRHLTPQVMTSHKTLLVSTLLLAYVSGAFGAVCPYVDDNAHTGLLLSDPDVFDLNLVDGIAAAGAQPGSFIHFFPAIAPAPLDWATVRGHYVDLFTNNTCKPTLEKILNNKNTWNNSYPDFAFRMSRVLIMNGKHSLVKSENLNDHSCRMFLYVLSTQNTAPTPAQIKGFRPGCIDNRFVFASFWTPQLVKLIPSEVFNSPLAVDLVAKNIIGNVPLYTAMTSGQLQAFQTDPDRCYKFNNIALFSNVQLASKLSPACVAEAPLFTTEVGLPVNQDQAKNFIKATPANAFSLVENLNSNLWQLLKAEHVANLDEPNKGIQELHCANLAIEQLPKTSFAKLPGTCFYGRFNTQDIPDANLGEKLAKLNSELLTNVQVSSGGRLASNLIKPSLYKFIGAKIWEKLLASYESCPLLVPPTGNNDKLPFAKFPVLSDSCFEMMPQETRDLFLSSSVGAGRLSESALSFFRIGDFSEQRYKEIAKSRPVLFKKLGSDTPAGESHFCAAISWDEHAKYKALLDVADAACINSLQRLNEIFDPDIESAKLKGLPRRFLAVQSLSDLLTMKNLPKDFWSTLTAPEFALLGTASNCKLFETPTLGSINAAALKGMSIDCLGILKADLSAAQVSNLDKPLFAALDTKTWPKVSKHVASLTPEQLTELGSKVTDLKQHPANSWTADTIKSLSADQAKGLNANTVTLLQSDAWAGFDESRLKALPPATLTKVTKDQLGKVPTDALLSLTAAQAGRLGEAVKDPKQHPRLAFTKEMLEKMKDKEAAKLLSGATRLGGVTTALLIATFAVFLFSFF